MIIRITAQTLPAIQTRLRNLPQDGSWEVVIREKTQARTIPQNARMWADLLDTITEQAMVEGKRYPREVWHDYLKRTFLPELDDPEIARKVREGYRKWHDTPDGGRQLVGSTTKLTKYGMSQYMQEVEAWAATDLGVIFYIREAA